MHKIKTLRCGDRATARSILFARDTSTDTVEARFQCWLIEAGDHTILIDAGLPAADPRVHALHDARTTTDLLVDNVDAGSVTDVVLTHLHWDHVGDADIFDNAAIHVQARELEFLRSKWFDHSAIRGLFAATDKLKWITNNPRLHPIEDESQIAQGVRASWVGGHTPGSQIILADLDGQRTVFTGDAANTRANVTHDIPPGIIWSMPQALGALARLRELEASGYTLLPAHEAANIPGRGRCE